MAVATETEIIKTAMERIGLRDKVQDLLDEIELQRRLKISEEQDEMGLYEKKEKVVKEILTELKSGHYARR
jgi:phosphate uptake regulator